MPSNIQDPNDQQYYLTLKTQRYEARRKQLIQAAISERETIIMEQQKLRGSTSTTAHNLSTLSVKNTEAAEEQTRIEVMKKR